MRRPLALAFPVVAITAFSIGCENPGGLASAENVFETSTQAVSLDATLLNAFGTSLREDLLTPYYPTAHDGTYGGFVEDRSGTWVLQQDGDKFLSAQARYIWTAAKASQFYATSNPTAAAQYKASAAVGFAFLQKMWRDPANGFGLMVDRNGANPRNAGKESYIVYGNAFGMYAAAAYYAASGDANALTLALNAFNYLDTYFYDPQYGGYYLTASDTRKETNTNVHVLEALIELYNDLPVSNAMRTVVGNRLAELLTRFHDSALHCPATNDCFAYPVMNQDWSSSTSDVSFGHDLELSMLMVQAIVALGQDPATSPYLAKIKKVVDFTFSHGGFRSDGGLYYTGTYTNGNVTINDSQLQWWPQAEGLGVLCRMRSLYPSDTTYEPLISKTWNFINTQIIDHTNHGWVRQAGDWNIAKAWEWHCNYHNSRALMGCLGLLTGAASCSDGIQNQGETGVDCGGPCSACFTNAIWLEAEAGTLSGSPSFTQGTDSAASGGKYLAPSANSPNAAGTNRATYTFTVSAGTYKVWGRVITPTADDDSLWVSMDGGSFVKWNSIPLNSSWAWDDVHNSDNGGAVMTYSLAQGSHTLVIANREDGIKLDKIYITAKGDTPSGMGGGTCTPTTCAALGAACGSPGNACGGTLACGTCATGQTCNASYQCVAPTNTTPVVNVGADRTVTLPATLALTPSVTDDGLPTPASLTAAWTQTSGPGTATFNPANAASTTITFPAAGTYVLRLTVSDGALLGYDEVQVTVSNASGNPCDGICNGATTFTMNGSYSSGSLGTSAVCRQTTSVVRGGNCGNFASGRTLTVNGSAMTCTGGNWSALPAARNGGYCVSVTSGNYAWGYFSLW